MEMKRLICLVLTITGSLSAPFEDANQLGQSSGSSKDHEDIVEITKFVRDQLAKDVQANRDFTEKSNEQSGMSLRLPSKAGGTGKLLGRTLEIRRE